MKKIGVVIFFLLNVYLFSHSQVYNNDIIIFRWANNTQINIGEYTKKVLFFENAIYPDNQTFLPYLNKIYNSIENFYPVSLKIDSLEYEIINYSDIIEYIDIENLGYDFIHSTFKTEERNSQKLIFQILPLCRTEDNKIKKIHKIYLTITYMHEEQLKLNEQKSSKQNISSSVLSQGNWYKFKVYSTGLYKITYEDLKNLGITNFGNIRIFGNGGRALPYSNKASRKIDLNEVPIIVEKGGDGVFNSGDYIIFYAEGPINYRYNGSMLIPEIHPYNNYTCYFLTVTSELGKGIVKQNELDSVPEVTLSTFDEVLFHENDLFNLIGSGIQWVGEKILNNFERSFDLLNYTGTSPIKFLINVVSRSSTSRNFSFYVNNNFISSISVPGVNFSDFTGVYARERNLYREVLITGEKLKLNIEYDGITSTDEGYLDYIYINYERRLRYNESPLFFRSIKSLKKITEFVIDNAPDNLIIWDITDINDIKEIKYRYNAGKAYFKIKTDILREFVAFRKEDVTKNVEFIGKIENQNLRSLETPDMIIVAHPTFTSYAEKLANFRRSYDKMDVVVVTTDQIYNEFSSGTRDATAIRDFVRMLYLKNKQKLRYLLLFGDGSFANKLDKQGNTNFIPTIQSKSSLEVYGSFTSDDFYGFMDDNEGNFDSLQYYMLDIAIGRIPVNDTSLARMVVDKIINYSLGKDNGDWQNTLVFIGDDEDNNLHMYQANQLADFILENYPEYFVKKIMLDAYKQVSSSVGKRYPEANRALQESFFNGMLILNYVGHGLETGLAEERIVSYEDIVKLKNNYKLPFFIASTCEFARYDNVSILDNKVSEIRSGGEMSLLNPNGGSIAMWSTTRVALSSLNYALNRRFYEYCFKKVNGQKLRLGEVIMYAKNNMGIDQNKLYYILLGDPSLNLRSPEYEINIDSINGKPLELYNDTLKAYNFYQFSGSIINDNNEIFESFNGKLIVTVLDKSKGITTLSNDGGVPFSFKSQESIIYKGLSLVKNGRFQFSFYVPKDIDYRIDQGKLIMFAYDSLNNYAGGYLKLLIGSSASKNIEDNDGPIIKIFMNDTTFVSGGITDSDPVLLVKLKDNYGINTTGNGIGHDLIAYLDDDYRNYIVLNNFYFNYANKYNEGEVRYKLSGLSEGKHKITVKAWDIFNNSSEENIEFVVVSSNNLILSNVKNYPNPFIDYTLFVFEHNMPEKTLNIEIKVYDLTGKLMTIIKKKLYSLGYKLEPIYWDGTNFNGKKLDNGIYIYHIEVTTNDGFFAKYSSKLMIK